MNEKWDLYLGKCHAVISQLVEMYFYLAGLIWNLGISVSSLFLPCCDYSKS